MKKKKIRVPRRWRKVPGTFTKSSQLQKLLRSIYLGEDGVKTDKYFKR